MFFKLAYQNAKRSRQENLIYFFTLVIAVASFYIILALENQDVIIYLRTFESEAVEKLFALMPVLYVIALLLIAFLVLFANRYQLDRRSREFGLYMVLGMRRRKLFLQLVTEGAISSCFALVGGIVVGGILSELVSLVTARLVGQGIIGHQLSFSLSAAGCTALAFLVIQCFVSLALGLRMFSRELHELLYGRMSKKQARGTTRGNITTLLVGLVLLGASYTIVLNHFTLAQEQLMFMATMLVAVLLCCIGTLLVIRGSARLIGLVAGSKRSSQTRGLRSFTLRQFQEFIANKPLSITASALLVFFAIVFLAAGASLILSSGRTEAFSVYDLTVMGEDQKVQAALASAELSPYVAELNRMELGYLVHTVKDDRPVVDLDWSGLREKLVAALPAGIPDPGPQQNGYSMLSEDPWELNLLKNLDSRMMIPDLIPQSSYNRLLEAAGLEPLNLASDEATFYFNPQFYPAGQALGGTGLDSLLRETQGDAQAPLRIGTHPLRLAPLPAMKALVADSLFGLAFAIIVPDALFDEQVDPANISVYWNFCIPQALEDEQGLLVPIKAASALLKSSGLAFESYLQNFGRQLFYVIAGSYTLLYLGFLFLIIGSTVLALQFLTQMRQARARYLTLSMLGAKRAQLRRCLHSQVAAYFLLPLALAIASGTVGVWVLLGFMLSLADYGSQLYASAAAVAGVVILIELLYAVAVAKTATHALERYLQKTRTE
ncbi:MAG: ABC transporter permease [Coriobacteriales bacterium]|jgi:putative ABC transport system permease protein|nr:ABC transporter permease [Coriobacteriales bacterium]